jgi:hypothetical protein
MFPADAPATAVNINAIIAKATPMALFMIALPVVGHAPRPNLGWRIVFVFAHIDAAGP